MSTEDGDIVTAIAESEEVDLFYTDCVMDMIDFKWERFASKIMYIGMIIHIVYNTYLLVYVKFTFLDPDTIEPDKIVPMHAIKKNN